MAYKIIRFFRRFDSGEEWKKTIKKGLTLEEAQAHCKDPETSSETRKGKLIHLNVKWFDGYEEVR